MNILQQFGLTHLPLFELRPDSPLWKNPQMQEFKQRFDWLMEQRGVGIITGDPGVGKTSLLRYHINELNPNHFEIIYQSEVCFSQTEVYRCFAVKLGLAPRFRRSELWCDLKGRIEELAKESRTLTWIADESHLAPHIFSRSPCFYEL